jgi:hypothetical protein
MNDSQQAAAVATYWAQAPLLPISRPPQPWPSIWRMMQDNQWCRNSVAVGMEATLRLAGVPTDRLTLQWIEDDQSVLLVLVIDHRLMLNYDWGSVRPASYITYTVLRQWRYIDKDYYILDG